MNNYELMSQKEMDEIDQIEVDKKILENVRNKSEETFSEIQIRKILNLMKQNLKDNEIIEFYCTGRNYTIDSARSALALSIVGAFAANPIFEWNTRGILIKTNMRMIFVEITMGLQYSNHYEISEEVHLVKKKNMFYLIVDGNNKKTVIEFNNKMYDLITNTISDKANMVIDKKFRCNNKYIFIFASIFYSLIIISAMLTVGKAILTYMGF